MSITPNNLSHSALRILAKQKESEAFRRADETHDEYF